MDEDSSKALVSRRKACKMMGVGFGAALFPKTSIAKESGKAGTESEKVVPCCGGGSSGDQGVERETISWDNFSNDVGKTSHHSSSIQMYEPVWRNSISQWEIDFAFSGQLTVTDTETGAVEDNFAWRQGLNISDEDAGDWYTREDPDWVGATDSPIYYDYEDNDVATGAVGLALSMLNPAIGTTFSAAMLLADFADYFGSSGYNYSWEPTSQKDILSIWQVFRREVPEDTGEFVDFKNVGFGLQELVTINEMQCYYYVGNKPSSSELTEVTSDNKDQYNLSPATLSELDQGEQIYVGDFESSFAKSSTNMSEEERQKLISQNY